MKIVEGNSVMIVVSKSALNTGIVPVGNVLRKSELTCPRGVRLYTTCITVLLGIVPEQPTLLPGLENYAQ